MSQYTVPEPDCSDKSLVRRPNSYVAGPAGDDGIIDANPVPTHEDARTYRTGDSAAKGRSAHQSSPLPTPPRDRRPSPLEVGIAMQSPPPNPMPQSQKPQQTLPERQPLWAQILRTFLRSEQEPSPAATPDANSPQATRPRMINITLMQDEYGWYLHFFISRGALSMLMGIVAMIALFLTGELSDAIKIFARLFY